MKTIKTYCYLIKPIKTQKDAIDTIFKYVAFVYNLYVEDVKSGKNMNRYAKDILKEYKANYPFLNKTDSSALMNVLFKMNELDKSNIKKIKKRTSYTTSKLMYGNSFYITTNNELFLPNVGTVRMIMHRDIPIGSELKSVTIRKDNTDSYFACIVLEYDRPFITTKLDMDKAIGIDYSSPYLYVDSNGKKAMIPHFYRSQQQKLSALQVKLAKKEYGTPDYYKTREKISRLYKKTKNQRNDWLHKASLELVNNYDIICLESLNMREMAQNKIIAKATYDNSYGLFEKMLEYKAKEKGKKIVYIDKWFPSSKKCSNCGFINNKLSLNDREWKCDKCGCIHDRDINSAINIKKEGKRMIYAEG